MKKTLTLAVAVILLQQWCLLPLGIGATVYVTVSVDGKLKLLQNLYK